MSRSLPASSRWKECIPIKAPPWEGFDSTASSEVFMAGETGTTYKELSTHSAVSH